MAARMKNPAMVLPEATKAIQELVRVVQSAGLPGETMGLVHLRASQINGCGFLRCLWRGERQEGRRERRASLRSLGLARGALVRRLRARRLPWPRR